MPKRLINRPLLILLPALIAVGLATATLIYFYDTPDQLKNSSTKQIRRHEIVWQMTKKAEALVESHKYPEAEKLTRRLIKITPDNIQLAKLLGESCYRQGKFQEAYEIYQKLSEKRPEDAANYNNMGQCLVMQNRLNEGINKLLVARDLDPDFPTIYLNLSTAYEKIGNKDAALDNYKRYLEKIRK